MLKGKLKIFRGSGLNEKEELIEKTEEYYSDLVDDIVRDDVTAREFILP